VRRNIQLLVIDPQNDFCDLPESHRPVDPLTGTRAAPALPVSGAHADLQRLAALVHGTLGCWSAISITLDSHNRLHIAHPTFWARGDGGTVPTFTTITARQVRAGEFTTRDPLARERALAYLDALEARGRYTLMVWPVHCEIGSWGHNVHADLRAAYNAWETRRLQVVRKVTKGSNLWTEHYSALEAEVPDERAPETLLDRALLAALDPADLLVVAGEASSHCVKATTQDLVAHLSRPERLVLLTDCMSPVAGFTAQHQSFLDEMRARGVRLATAAELRPELEAGS
jgi:nicotinamidase/pyrazinamidase